MLAAAAWHDARPVARVLAALLGVWMVGQVCMSAVRTVVVPRSRPQRITRRVFMVWRRATALLSTDRTPFERIDARLSLAAPLAFVSLPVVWLVSSGVGFVLVHWGVSGRSLRDAYLASGSSLLTLGVAFRRDLAASSVTFLEAILGLGLVALLISYLPTIYGAYARRETLVGMLESRAGLPPSPGELLLRYRRIDAFDRLDDDLFEPWEVWFAELEESHTSFPGLAFFRSPHPARSWITAAGAVLDTAAVRLSLLDLGFSAPAALCLRQGFLSLRRVCAYFGIDTPHDPGPGDPIGVTRAEFDAVAAELGRQGLPLVVDRDAAWVAFRGWRVNYDAALVALCRLVHAPPGIWSSDRPGATPTLRRSIRARPLVATATA